MTVDEFARRGGASFERIFNQAASYVSRRRRVIIYLMIITNGTNIPYIAALYKRCHWRFADRVQRQPMIRDERG